MSSHKFKLNINKIEQKDIIYEKSQTNKSGAREFTKWKDEVTLPGLIRVSSNEKKKIRDEFSNLFYDSEYRDCGECDMCRKIKTTRPIHLNNIRKYYYNVCFNKECVDDCYEKLMKKAFEIM
jgi:hypothetical protein